MCGRGRAPPPRPPLRSLSSTNRYNHGVDDPDPRRGPAASHQGLHRPELLSDLWCALFPSPLASSRPKSSRLSSLPHLAPDPLPITFDHSTHALARLLRWSHSPRPPRQFPRPRVPSTPPARPSTPTPAASSTSARSPTTTAPRRTASPPTATARSSRRTSTPTLAVRRRTSTSSSSTRRSGRSVPFLLPSNAVQRGRRLTQLVRALPPAGPGPLRRSRPPAPPLQRDPGADQEGPYVQSLHICCGALTIAR